MCFGAFSELTHKPEVPSLFQELQLGDGVLEQFNQGKQTQQLAPLLDQQLAR